jgi:hypothetical protein
VNILCERPQSCTRESHPNAEPLASSQLVVLIFRLTVIDSLTLNLVYRSILDCGRFDVDEASTGNARCAPSRLHQ